MYPYRLFIKSHLCVKWYDVPCDLVVLWLDYVHVIASKPLKFCAVMKLSKGKMYLKVKRATLFLDSKTHPDEEN